MPTPAPIPFLLDSTVGGATANSYVDVASATAILQVRGYQSWTDAAATADMQAMALVAATEDIDTLAFYGFRAFFGQRLQFPRSRQEPQDPIMSIPYDVQRATCEQAVWILANKATGGQSPRQQMQAQGVTEFEVGHLKEVFARTGWSRTMLSPKTLQLMTPYLMSGGHLIGSQEVARGERLGEGNYGWQFR